MSFHAKLSPSASHRWMNCPGSVKLIGDESSTTNQAAMLGTAAHKLIEIMITNGHEDANEYAGSTFLVKADGDEETEFYPPGTPALDPEHARPGWFMFIADEKMIEGVQQTIDLLPAFARGHTTDDLGAVIQHLFGMKRAVAAGDALHNDLRILINKYGHIIWMPLQPL